MQEKYELLDIFEEESGKINLFPKEIREYGFEINTIVYKLFNLEKEIEIINIKMSRILKLDKEQEKFSYPNI